MLIPFIRLTELANFIRRADRVVALPIHPQNFAGLRHLPPYG